MFYDALSMHRALPARMVTLVISKVTTSFIRRKICNTIKQYIL